MKKQRQIEEEQTQQNLLLDYFVYKIGAEIMKEKNKFLETENQNLWNQIAQNNKKYQNFQDQLFQMKNGYENQLIGIKRKYEEQLSEINNREQQKAIQLRKERKNAISECTARLSEEFKACINNSIKEYNIISEKWINQISINDIENIKNNFKNLFQRLFYIENIQNTITSKFIEIIEKNYLKKRIKNNEFYVHWSKWSRKKYFN
jgi:hypothetical protein